MAVGRREALHRGLATIVRTQHLALALVDEVDEVIGPGTEIAVLVYDLSHDEGGVLALIVHRQTDGIGSTCRADGLLTDHLSVLSRHGLHLARVEGDAP